MQNKEFEFIFTLMVMAITLRISNEIKDSQPKSLLVNPALADNRLIKKTQKPIAITLQQRAWSEKAVKRYTEAQEKKWQKWNEAMFEKVK